MCQSWEPALSQPSSRAGRCRAVGQRRCHHGIVVTFSLCWAGSPEKAGARTLPALPAWVPRPGTNWVRQEEQRRPPVPSRCPAGHRAPGRVQRCPKSRSSFPGAASAGTQLRAAVQTKAVACFCSIISAFAGKLPWRQWMGPTESCVAPGAALLSLATAPGPRPWLCSQRVQSCCPSVAVLGLPAGPEGTMHSLIPARSSWQHPGSAAGPSAQLGQPMLLCGAPRLHFWVSRVNLSLELRGLFSLHACNPLRGLCGCTAGSWPWARLLLWQRLWGPGGCPSRSHCCSWSLGSWAKAWSECVVEELQWGKRGGSQAWGWEAGKGSGSPSCSSWRTPQHCCGWELGAWDMWQREGLHSMGQAWGAAPALGDGLRG